MGFALAFRDARSGVATDVLAVGDRLAATLPRLNAFSATGPREEFRFKTADVDVNGLLVSAYAQSGSYLERDAARGFELTIPLQGRGHTIADGLRHDVIAGENAFLSAAETRKTVPAASAVRISLDPETLNATCATILGADYRERIAARTRTPDLTIGDISFFTLFKSVFAQIDGVGDHPDILGKLALDDALYRLCAGLLYPRMFSSDETLPAKRPHPRIELAQLCDYLAAHLTQPISLTQMEQRSGLSARVLQYSFQGAYGMRPKEWLRKQRLHAARAILEKLDQPITLTSLAYDFCFASPSAFSKYYQAEFGEPPSETLRRFRRQPMA